jgi:hypothetical protein
MSTSAHVNMCDMNAPTLPMPNPADWATRAGAAAHLGVDAATVSRMVVSGRLTAYWPRGGKGEKRTTLFWWPEVVELGKARKVALGRG